jgi:transposase
MLQRVPHLRILLAVEPVDFRKGLDALTALCRNQWQQDPFSGTLYVFRHRAATALKLVVYDGNGFWLCLRRFLLRQTVMVARHGRRTAASARGAAVDGSSLPRASRASTFLSFVASAGLIQSRFFLSSSCPYVG